MVSCGKGQYVVYSVTSSLVMRVTTVTPVVTGMMVHLLSSQEVMVITAVDTSVSVLVSVLSLPKVEGEEENSVTPVPEEVLADKVDDKA